MKKISDATSSFMSGVLTLAKGTFLAKLIGLLCIPLLTRLYSAEDYGLVALYTSLVAILSPMLSFRYVQAIPLPKYDKIAINILYFSLILSVLSSIILSVIFYIWGEVIFNFFGLTLLFNWWPMVIIGALGTSIYEVLSLWSVRKKDYKVLANSQITQSVGGNSSKVLVGIFWASPLGLILGQVISQCGGILNFVKVFHKELKELLINVSILKLVFVAIHFREFLYFRAISQLLMLISLQAPILMMAALFNEERTGQLSLSIMTLSLPVSMIGAVVSKAFYSEIAKLGKAKIDKIKQLSTYLQMKLFLIGVPISTFIFFFAEPLFSIVFGKEWLQAGKFASILAPYILFQFTSGPLMEVFNIVGKQFYYFVVHSLRLFGLVMLYIFSKYYDLNDVEFIWSLSGYLTFFYMSITIFVNVYLKRKGNVLD